MACNNCNYDSRNINQRYLDGNCTSEEIKLIAQWHTYIINRDFLGDWFKSLTYIEQSTVISYILNLQHNYILIANNKIFIAEVLCTYAQNLQKSFNLCDDPYEKVLHRHDYSYTFEVYTREPLDYLENYCTLSIVPEWNYYKNRVLIPSYNQELEFVSTTDLKNVTLFSYSEYPSEIKYELTLYYNSDYSIRLI